MKPRESRAGQRLDRRRVYLLPTASGLTFGAMQVVILLGAINYDNALGYLLAFLLFGLVLVAMLHTARNLIGLAYLGARAQPVFAGEDARFTCRFANDARQARLRLAVGPWARGLKRAEKRFWTAQAVAFDVEAGGQVDVVVPRLAARRGWQDLGRLRVTGAWPLGILRAWAYFDGEARCLVYPAPRGRLPLPVTPSAGAQGTLALAGGAEEFAGLRRYVPGDPVRAIAWKSAARERELEVKRFHGQGAARVLLSWQAVASLGDTEARLAQLCQWVLEASRRGLVFALELPGAPPGFGSGASHRDACLRALALYEARP
ncbi:MAG: DUF58 domain-containing protein [Gammaproteobacteria bacterium]